MYSWELFLFIGTKEKKINRKKKKKVEKPSHGFPTFFVNTVFRHSAGVWMSYPPAEVLIF
jgi:hypothetical protein